MTGRTYYINTLLTEEQLNTMLKIISEAIKNAESDDEINRIHELHYKLMVTPIDKSLDDYYDNYAEISKLSDQLRKALMK